MSSGKHKVGDVLILVPGESVSDHGLPVQVGRITDVTENADGSTTYALVPNFEPGLGYAYAELP